MLGSIGSHQSRTQERDSLQVSGKDARAGNWIPTHGILTDTQQERSETATVPTCSAAQHRLQPRRGRARKKVRGPRAANWTATRRRRREQALGEKPEGTTRRSQKLPRTFVKENASSDAHGAYDVSYIISHVYDASSSRVVVLWMKKTPGFIGRNWPTEPD
jgi:hypothetical protein